VWRSLGRLLAGATLLLAGCGDLPQPFRGAPGADAMRLAQPPPSRLAVPPPGAALLDAKGAAAYAGAVAAALAEAEVPAIATSPKAGEWVLVLTAEVAGNNVVPFYAVEDPKGVSRGISQGPPIPAAAWAVADPAMLQAAAAAAAPGVSALLTNIEAARRQSDPTSLVNRPGRIFLAGVTGAPGDGNQSLQQQMTTKLTAQGLVVQETGQGADFTVTGQVVTAPGANGTRRVEVQWLVVDAGGTERGRILQINEVPPASIARYWGDVATAVATEASGGVRDVVLTQAGTRNAPARNPAAAKAGA